jgi:hypothetical protein
VDLARQLRVEAEFLFLGVDFVIGFALLKFGLPILADEDKCRQEDGFE